MAVADQTTLGPQTNTYDRRALKGVFEYGGMVPDGNPASIPENRVRLLYNTRRRGGGFVPRGGQSKLNANALHDSTACIRGLFDFQIGTKKSLQVISNGCPSISTSAGFSFGSSDFDQSPVFQSTVYYNGSTQTVTLAPFGDDLYIGNDAELRKFQPINAPYGTAALSQSGTSQDIPLLTPSGTTKITCQQQFDGDLYIGCDSGTPGTCKVVAWDGITERDDFTGINAPTGFGLYRENIILGYGGSPNEIRVRAMGSSPGTWTQYTPGAGTAAFKKGVSYKDVFYFTTGGEDLFSFNGTTLTRIPVATTGIPAGSTTWGIAVFNNLLYFTYTTSGNNARLAKYNGSAWTAVEKNFTTQFASCTAVRPMVSYRGNLVVGATDVGGGVLYESPGTTTTGTWTRSTLGNFSGSIIDLVVY